MWRPHFTDNRLLLLERSPKQRLGELRKERSEATMTEGLRCRGGGWGDMEAL